MKHRRSAMSRLRFHRRLSILPGLRVNFSKSGASVSVGHRGADHLPYCTPKTPSSVLRTPKRSTLILSISSFI
jgi:hypothetical protein